MSESESEASKEGSETSKDESEVSKEGSEASKEELEASKEASEGSVNKEMDVDTHAAKSEEIDDDAPAAKSEEIASNKRQHDDVPDESDESDNEWIGPMPTEAAAPAKKKKGMSYNLDCGSID